jgi:Na+/proline symporter
MTDAQARGRARFVTALVCGVALLFSLDKESVLFDLVLFAWTGITATFCPPLILSLFWRGLTRAGTVAAMLWGMFWTFAWTLKIGEGEVAVAWVTTYLWDGFSGSAEEAMLPAFFGALVVAVLVSLVTEPPPDAEQVLAEAGEQVVDLWR